MTAENILSHLQRVKQTGSNKWIACCPAHDDRGPSLSIRELDDGRVLMHCFAGCDVQTILSAVQLEFDALYPQQAAHALMPERRPFPASDVLRAVAFEALVVLCVGTAMAAGKALSAADRARLSLACSRLQAAIDAGGLNNA